DIENVMAVQAGYRAQPLSQFLARPAPPQPAAIDFMRPLSPEAQRTSPDFFELLNFVLQFCPMHPSEVALMTRFGKLGIGGGKRFNFEALAPELQQAVRDGMADAWADFARFKQAEVDTGKRTASEGFGSRDHLQN